MDKLKNIFKMVATNKMQWIAFVVVMLLIIGAVATVGVIEYNKEKEAREILANAKIENSLETIKQEELVDTSKMTEEELKKLNEEEVKQAEKKQKEEDKKKGTKTTKPVKNKYYIKVNYGAQAVTIYTYDKNGNYTVPVRACICSTGAATPTSGVYRMGYKWVWGKLYGNVWGHYSCQIVGDILFHSVPYKQAKNDTLVSAYYDRLGTKDSMGCIRLTTIDAQWIYNNCPSGTQVEFYSSSNPGPLGKPTAKKVSNAPGKLKNWDPTDPATNNPWRTYKPKEENKNTTTNNIVTNTTTNTVDNTTNNTVNNTTNNTINNTTNSTTNSTTTINNTTNNVVVNDTQSGNVNQNSEINGNQNTETQNNTSQNITNENPDEKPDTPINNGETNTGTTQNNSSN